MNVVQSFDSVAEPLPVQEFLQSNALFLTYFDKDYLVSTYSRVGLELFDLLKHEFDS